MSVNKRQCGTDIVINNRSQGTVDMHLRYCGIFQENLLQNHYWVCLWKNVKISQHLAKLRARKLIYWFIYSRALCEGIVLLKARIWQEIAVVNCCYMIFTWLRQLSNRCRPILTYKLTLSESNTFWTIISSWWILHRSLSRAWQFIHAVL